MYLKHPMDPVALFEAIDRCTGDVLLHTREKDVLNLRSQLCRFLFAVALSEEAFFDHARVECANESDYEILSAFLTA